MSDILLFTLLIVAIVALSVLDRTPVRPDDQS